MELVNSVIGKIPHAIFFEINDELWDIEQIVNGIKGEMIYCLY